MCENILIKMLVNSEFFLLFQIFSSKGHILVNKELYYIKALGNLCASIWWNL